eukprot:gene3101-13115_t
MLLGLSVRLRVKDSSWVEVYVADLNDVVRLVILDVVENHMRTPWLPPPLFFMCSEVCGVVRKKLNNLDIGLDAVVKTGFWIGPVDGVFSKRVSEPHSATGNRRPPYEHNWLAVSYRGATMHLDPTYLQFGSEGAAPWSFEQSLAAIAHTDCSATIG